MKVYLLWASYHKQEKEVLIAIYKEYKKALERLQEIQIDFYVDEVELYISENEVRK